MDERTLAGVLLKQIGGWRVGLTWCPSPWAVSADGPEIDAEVPALQRGLVWKPQQVEVLWDSLARGLPLGSLLLVPREGGKSDILDGQQRSYAVALGFDDPWADGADPGAILWWDLAQPRASERSYLFRLTTRAHPWGFKDDAGSSRLAHHRMQKVVAERGARPSPKRLLPLEARLPVPLGWLLRRLGQKPAQGWEWEAVLEDYWGWVVEQGLCPEGSSALQQLREAGAILTDGDHRRHIEGAARRILSARIPAIIVPTSVAQEPDSLELLFERFNRQGTPVSSEELQYAMLKSRWPEARDHMGRIESLPTSDYHLAVLAIRVALTGPDAQLRGPANVRQIRGWFADQTSSATRESVEAYFRDELPGAVRWVDQVVLYDEGSNSFGIPRFLRTVLAWRSSEVYALLLLIGRRLGYAALSEGLRKKVIALALSLHWFAPNKPDAVSQVSKLFTENSRAATEDVLRAFKLNCLENGSALMPMTPTDLERLLRLEEEWDEGKFTKEVLWNQWEFQHIFLLRRGVGVVGERERNNRDLYWRITQNAPGKELLLYRQRGYIERSLGDFDPADRVYWEGHDRPWDYDHIHPHGWLDARGRGLRCYTDVAKAFNQSLGNLVAVDLSYNRSTGDSSPLGKERYFSEHSSSDTLDAEISQELLEAAGELRLEDTGDFGKVVRFAKAVGRRTAAIYRHWFEALEVAALLE